MKRYRLRDSDWQLVNKQTGELADVDITIYRGASKFMKLWQNTSWDSQISKLQGNSVKVLWKLVHIATWNNQVPGPSAIATMMGMRQPHVSKAYKELINTDFLQRINGAYRLNPYFCWKGNDEQYQAACRELIPPSHLLLTM